MSNSIHSLMSSPDMNWLEACQWLTQLGQPYCIATVIAEAGSVPRATGSKMVISASHQFDTLGGGKLEHQIIHKARQALASGQEQVQIERFSLAADLGQCCGGAVQVMLEFMQTQLPKVAIFGAGHVCQALCQILSGLPCHVQVIDSREEWLTPLAETSVNTLYTSNPGEAIAELQPDTHILVMTHDHAVDYEIILKALEQRCFPFIGLIASKGKKQRFEFRLKEQLSDASLLAQLTSPIGKPDIKGKLPMQVAVSVSAQLMECFEKINLPAGDKQQSSNNQKNWSKANELRKALSGG